MPCRGSDTGGSPHRMITRIGTSLVTAFVLYCLLFDVSSIFYSISRSAKYESTSTPSGVGIRMITSAQPHVSLPLTALSKHPELSAVKEVKRIFALFRSRLREILQKFTRTVANLFRRKKTLKVVVTEEPIKLIPQNSPNKDNVYPISWGGSPITEKEKVGLDFLEAIRRNYINDTDVSSWLQTATSTDLLRFLRARNGNAEEAFKNILAHARWRLSLYGADTVYNEHTFNNSAMKKEVFWLGVSSSDCPTLVVRTQAHDGADYNEDPRIFTSFMVSVIEEGIRKYGVGTSRQVCVLLDRSTYLRAGVKKKEDMSVIPNLVKLFQHLYSTITENYPDLLSTAQIVPASWFFSVCYKITSRVMDQKTRAKFQTVKAEHIFDVFRKQFPSEILPPHLGGTCGTYGPNPLNNVLDSTGLGSTEGETISSAGSRLLGAFKTPFSSSKSEPTGANSSTTGEEVSPQVSVGSGSMVQGAIIETDFHHHDELGIGEIDVERVSRSGLMFKGEEKEERDSVFVEASKGGRHEIEVLASQGHTIEGVQGVASRHHRDRNHTGNVRESSEARWSSRESCKTKSNSEGSGRGDLTGNCILDSSAVAEIYTDAPM